MSRHYQECFPLFPLSAGWCWGLISFTGDEALVHQERTLSVLPLALSLAPLLMLTWRWLCRPHWAANNGAHHWVYPYTSPPWSGKLRLSESRMCGTIQGNRKKDQAILRQGLGSQRTQTGQGPTAGVPEVGSGKWTVGYRKRIFKWNTGSRGFISWCSLRC